MSMLALLCGLGIVAGAILSTIWITATPTSKHTSGCVSHVCQSCGELYYTEYSDEIPKCRTCGGVRVENA